MSKFKIWLQACRLFSYTASMVPVLLGAAMAYSAGGEFRWGLLPIVILCSLLFHAGTNLLNDYADYKKGVDKDYSLGGSRVLPDGLLSPSAVLRAGAIAFIVGISLGLALIYIRGWWMLVIGGVGFLGGVLYTVLPGYKYIGLGDVMVFILMGPLMVIGSYFTLAGGFAWNVFYVSLPIGFLVSAILWANNLRDINHDIEAGIKTVVIMLGFERAKMVYNFLLLGAYISVAALVVLKILSAVGFIVLITAPLAVQNIMAVKKAQADRPEMSVGLDAATAKLHLAFGGFLIISVLIGKTF